MRGRKYESEFRNSQQIPLSVQPLNSVPYIGSPTSVGGGYHASPIPTKGNAESVEEVGPSMILLDSSTTRKEWDNILVSAKSAVALTGSAAMGMVGPVLGLMDIGECDDAYLFRVSLPGVANNGNEFSCDIEPDGKIHIRGVTTTGEKIVCKNSQIFKMQSRNLCLPGHFSITFQLPGPVDHQKFSGHFGIDGMLEGIVKKKHG
ncbi:alpha-crystallin domain-containing protein 22.3 [Mercurialis annua]|uniref:alpha-crystallin domain-containing protein 22.3 n=1 Tax=Mercurialis annua TaxID=3986 RepID=UPI00216061B1|nr:alpha-crystallin domain-containing protein 22.3 [Mercurialis annua]